MSVTIKDVAKEAGVSVATVSRVLNGSCNVSDESTKKVNETIAKLNYSPNFLGRNLRKCETNVILVIMPTSEHSLYSKIVMGMQDYAGKVGYDIITAVSYSTSTAETRQMNMLFNRTVDGVVLLGTQYDAESLNKLAENYNVALCCEGVEGANVLTVAVDDEQAAFDAVVTLIKKGHRKIGFIGTKTAAVSSTARENGYIRALKEHGIEVREDYFYKESYDYDCGERAFEHFNSLEEKPTAIFAVSDLLAISAMHKAIDMGVEVGKDIAIMGFDNISMCEWIVPTLSTVEQPCSKMGELVVAKLIENMNKTTKDNHYYTVDHKIILRQSTGD
ncbi:LacI family DNA-binding transcriptional regulator [uncultured Ruminococcus sp.]|uniref:LacI family DNA-binding transcriptional regulator n=1 Tax=uncultured Ruminococcus sp. TaxID=165186 RepID=UPI0025F0F780|nr:LacI family DNA-binding transcriptional regulator [uncultured Ruminococcus sp.]